MLNYAVQSHAFVVHHKFVT